MMTRVYSCALMLLLGCATEPTLDPSISPENGLSRASIDDAIRTRLSGFRACYQHSLANNPDLEGRVVLEIEIDPEGRVSWVEVANSTLQHAETESCLTEHMAGLAFEPPRGGGTVTVTYPFAFAPG
jgi:TonB family protein